MELITKLLKEVKTDKYLIYLAMGQKGNNRNEKREVIVATLLVRLCHCVFNLISNKIACQMENESCSKSSNK